MSNEITSQDFANKLDTILADVRQYIMATYGEHYVGELDIQTVDVWETLGIAFQMLQGTALKYLMRLGKKDGINPKDLLKTLHYTLLLLYLVSYKNVSKSDQSSGERLDSGRRT